MPASVLLSPPAAIRRPTSLRKRRSPLFAMCWIRSATPARSARPRNEHSIREGSAPSPGRSPAPPRPCPCPARGRVLRRKRKPPHHQFLKAPPAPRASRASRTNRPARERIVRPVDRDQIPHQLLWIEVENFG